MAYAPWLFVFLWSTGFIGTKLGIPFAAPLTFLCVRLSIASALLFVLVPLLKEPWIRSASHVAHAAIVGILLHGFYLGGVFIAIDRGVDAGFSALVVGLQPLCTVLLASVWLKESITRRKLIGILLGLLGVTVVVFDRGLSVQGLDSAGFVFCLLALFGITTATLYQKRFCTDIPMVCGAAVQYLAVSAVLLPLSLLFEDNHIQWTPTFLFALSWLILVLSLGAVLLLMLLLRQGEAGNVASLFYLVPPIVAVESWLLFGETLSAVSALGFVLCAAGVALVVRQSLR